MSNSEHQNRRLIPRTVVWTVGALIVLMLAGSTLLVFGQEGPDAYPSALNTKPSGLAAFYNLLRADGYDVVIDRDERPKLEGAGLVVEVRQEAPKIDWSGIVQGLEDEEPTITKSLRTFSEGGGKILSLMMPADFSEASRAATRKEVTLKGRKFAVSSLPDAGESFLTTEAGKPPVVVAEVGLGVTNRFLGKEDNAAFYLSLFRGLAKPGSKVVFAEASFGNVQNRTLVDEFGSWAGIAIWQALLALGVGLFAIGRRFGLPVPDRFNERGTSELVASMGSALHRSKRYDQALMILLDDAYDRMRRSLNAPLGTDAAELTKQAPAPLAESIVRIRKNYGSNLTSREWLELSERLEHDLAKFELEAKSRRSLGIKLK